MKNIQALCAMLLLCVSGLASAGNPTKAYTVLEEMGDVSKHDPITTLFDAGPQSVWGWYDIANLSKSNMVTIDVFDCSKKNCNGNKGWNLVAVLTAGESYLFKGAYNTAKGISDDWKFVVLDNCKGTADFKFKVSAVPELGTWALMLLGMLAMGLMLRHRNKNDIQ
jgi:hypothetical protein